ncbi:MAG: hypothetical protein AB7O78_04670 [Thermoleophilia bacterium]
MGDHYEIRVAGELTPAVAQLFEGLEATAAPRTTVLHGVLPDRAALHGIIERVQALGLELVEVRRVTEDPRDVDRDD